MGGTRFCGRGKPRLDGLIFQDVFPSVDTLLGCYTVFVYVVFVVGTVSG